MGDPVNGVPKRSRLLLGSLVTAGLLALDPRPAFAHGGAPAGGAPVEDLIPAAVVGALLIAVVAAFGWAHRSGRTSLLTRVSHAAERASGLAGFAALPTLITGVSLLVAVFGFYWDVATHIDNGRDPGPFANPSHWFILFGLLGIALAGVAALLLGSDEDLPSSVRLRRGWHVPVGGILLALCGVVAVLGFPLDDVWHRIFGQDVTLWSPTHIQMVGGASLSTLALWVLVEEGRRFRGPSHPPERAARARDVAIAGAFLVGASTLQGEFDYAVPQFRLLYQPILLMFAAGVALVPARIRLGRGGALAAALVFLALRGLLTLLVTPVLGRTTLHFPLYLGAAVAVELVALRVPVHRQVTFGAWAGAGVGTLGLAGEWAWSHVWMPIPWPAALLPEALLAVPAAIAACVVGGFIGRALTPSDRPREDVAGWVGPAVAVGLVFILAYPMPMTTEPGASVTVTLEEVEPEPARTVHATVRLEPRDVAEGAEYVNVTAWQGAEWTRASSFLDPLQRVEQGVYRTTRPLPVHGEWKALVRLQRNRVNIAAPIYLPRDEAIPADEVAAEERFTRDFVANRQLLLREAKDAAGWLTAVSYAGLGLLLVAWVVAIAWGLSRLRRGGAEAPLPGDVASTREEQPWT